MIDSIKNFFKFYYFSLKRLCRCKIDIYTLNQITYLPLFVCQKLIISFLNKNCGKNIENSDLLILDSNSFIENFYILYFGNISDKIKLISKFLSFDGKFVYYNDVKLLLLHLHMRLFNDKTENSILTILNNFFNGIEKININNFSQICLEKNFDIIFILLAFFNKLKFFTNEHIKFFDSYYTSFHNESRKKEKSFKYLRDTSLLNSSALTNSTSILNNSFDEFRGNSNNFQRYFSHNQNNNNNIKIGSNENIFENNLNISIKAKTYVHKIKIIEIFNENFEEEDNEMRICLKTFEEDIVELKSKYFNLNEQIFNNSSINNLNFLNIENNFIKEEEFSEETNYDKKNFLKKNTDFFPKIKTFGLEIKKNTTINSSYDFNNLNLNDSSYNLSFLKSTSLINSNNLNNLNASFCSSNNNFSNNFFLYNSIYQPSNSNNNYFIINCYKLSASSKFKEVKLIFFDNIIFYFDNKIISNNSNFKMKYFIIITQLYPKIIKNPNINKNLITFLQEYEQKEVNIFQLQLVSTIHCEKITNNFFLTNYEEALKCEKYIQKIQNFKNLRDFYNIKLDESKELGNGHFGKVYLVNHLISNLKVSLKIIKKYNNKNNFEDINENGKNHKIEDFKCIQWEKDIFIFLHHITQCKNIIKCYEYIETEEEIYFINEYCCLGNIKYIQGIEKTKSLINNLAIQLIRGIECLHKYGIIHRDIKNANSLITLDEEKKVVLKIIDFGLSKVIGYKEFVKDDYGSLPFKSPELINGKFYNFSVDIWALGITIFWLVYEKYPCNGGNRNKTKNLIVDYEYKPEFISNEEKNELYNEIMLKCLINDYKKRFNINNLKNMLYEKVKNNL
jgi:hypothetical protein